MFEGDFILIGLDGLNKVQLESWFAYNNRRMVYVKKAADINADLHRNGDVSYVVDLSKISSYASDILAKIAEFHGTAGVCFVVLVNKRIPKLLKKFKFKTLELRWE